MEILANSALTSEQVDLIRTLNRAIPGFEALIASNPELGKRPFGEWLNSVLLTREAKQALESFTSSNPPMTTTAVNAAISTAVAGVGGSTPEYLGAAPTGMPAPTGGWNLSGNLTAVAGDDLSLVAGTARYQPNPHIPDEKWFRFDGATDLKYDGANKANYASTGAMSVMALAHPTAAADMVIAEYHSRGGADTEVNNCLWSMGLFANGSYLKLRAFHESGVGVNNSWQSDEDFQTSRWAVFTVTRNAAGDTYKLYYNHVELSGSWVEGSSTAPTGGSNSNLIVGMAGGTSPWRQFQGHFGGLYYWDSELSASQVAAGVNIMQGWG